MCEQCGLWGFFRMQISCFLLLFFVVAIYLNTGCQFMKFTGTESSDKVYVDMEMILRCLY